MTVSLDRLEPIEAELRHLRDALVGSEQSMSGPSLRPTRVIAVPLRTSVHYVELRHHDVRKLQARLGALGMSSLGRSEACVLANVEAVLAMICRLNGTATPGSDTGIELGEGQELLRAWDRASTEQAAT